MALPPNYNPERATFAPIVNMNKEDWIASRTDNPDKLGQKTWSNYYDKLKKAQLRGVDIEDSEIEDKMLDEYLEKCGVAKEFREKAHTVNIRSSFRNMDSSCEQGMAERVKERAENFSREDKKAKKKEPLIYNIPSGKEMNF